MPNKVWTLFPADDLLPKNGEWNPQNMGLPSSIVINPLTTNDSVPENMGNEFDVD